MPTSFLPYGSWPSTITSQQLTQKTVRLCEPQLDNGHCYWLEQRPEEQGRCVVVCRPSGSDTSHDISPKGISVRTKAHEYGGGSYLVDNDTLYFVNGDDQRVYSVPVEGNREPLVLSPEGAYRYADFFIDHTRQQLIGVCEIHKNNHSEPENNIISLRLDGSSTIGLNILVFGNDFYSNPSVSPDGEKLAWLTWSHPNMPWDNSECWIADFTSTGMLHKQRKVAGNAGIHEGKDIAASTPNQKEQQRTTGESIFQPQWSPTGDLLFISDRNNWWNLYSYNTFNKYTECLLDMPAEFATPQWVFGMSTYQFLNSYTVFCSYTQNGQWYIATLDLMTHTFTPLETPFTYIEAIRCQDDNDTAIFIGATDTSQPEIIRWRKEDWESIARGSDNSIATEQIAKPQAITFKNSQQHDVHGFFYAPQNADYQGPKENTPPLIVTSHGGPTGATSAYLSLKVQYWTNRGFAVFDINYSGSTGYGRVYRRRLYSQWGINDVDDLCTGAQYIAAQGWANADQMAIRGSSAGGYSVLAALTFKDTFKAGASLYGIGDLSSLAEDTHKFESRYLDQLVGKYPEDKALYDARSPLHHIEQLNCPVIFLQGLDDKVVPPNQAEMMVNALVEKDIPVAYVTFNGEGHGFRQAANIQYAIDAEYAFYSSVFALQPSNKLVDVPFIKHTTDMKTGEA